MTSGLLRLRHLFGLALLTLAGIPLAAAPLLHRDVLVFIPAYEASQLWDPDLADTTPDSPECVWGNLNTYFSTTLYFGLRMPNPLVPRLLLRVGPVDVYGHLVESLTKPDDARPGFHPYTLGSDFFIFTYDWRQELATNTAPKFAQAMESYARIHAEKTGIPAGQTQFIIVTHSMGGLVARTWLSENPAWAPRVSRLYMAGAPNRGSVKAARTVVYGPDSVKNHAHGFPGILLNLLPTGVDQKVTKLVGITRPTLYELLPYDDPRWTANLPGKASRQVGADELLQVRTWQPYWPTAKLERDLFLNDWLAKREAEGKKTIHRQDWEYCQDPALPKLGELLRTTAAWRARQGSLQHTASLLTRGSEPTRLRIIASTGILTAAGFVTHGTHDSATAEYTFQNGMDGDGTMEAKSVLDGFAPYAPNVKMLQRVPHGRLMIAPEFLTYFLGELSHQPTVAARN